MLRRERTGKTEPRVPVLVNITSLRKRTTALPAPASPMLDICHRRAELRVETAKLTPQVGHRSEPEVHCFSRGHSPGAATPCIHWKVWPNSLDHCHVRRTPL